MSHRHEDVRYEPAPVNVGKPWDDAQDQQLRQLLDAGKSVANIAAEMGRTRPGVAARCEFLGWHARSGAELAAQTSTTEGQS